MVSDDPAFGPALRLSPAVTEINESKTNAIFSQVQNMKSRGEIVNGALCVGQPDFAPPPGAIKATAEAAEKGMTNYTALTGTLELRREIADYLAKKKQVKYTPEEILVGNGGKQVIFQVMLALCQRGDEVIVPAPYWTSYPDIVKISGATPSILNTTSDQGYDVDPSALAAAIRPATRMVILCNPSNPTGCAMDRKKLEALAEVLRRPEHQHVYVLSDEIYERICFDGLDHVSFAGLDGMWNRTLTINGFSKCFSMTGYRLGYIAAPLPIIKAAAKLQSQITSCASSVSQHAALAAMRSASTESYIDGKVLELQAKRDLSLELLLAIPEVKCPKPGGAFYLFPDISAYFGRSTEAGEVVSDATAFCLHLLTEYKVALVPGEAFGAKDCIRLSYAATVEDIRDAISKLGACLRSLRDHKRARVSE
eukprot:TRINITY_DN11760_c0_g2_i1.p1 TRINITY_DN11760_c0_g2~~TRINITY_DN11760_c0_g2_i1.p1  ORF type:complete len:445 (+),score=60.08 TRINITY_DN11760_c0_g2_i1:66-1337(+)